MIEKLAAFLVVWVYVQCAMACSLTQMRDTPRPKEENWKHVRDTLVQLSLWPFFIMGNHLNLFRDDDDDDLCRG